MQFVGTGTGERWTPVALVSAVRAQDCTLPESQEAPNGVQLTLGVQNGPLKHSRAPLGIDAFRAELAASPAFASTISGYAQAFVAFVTQSVACNGLHQVEARCGRWLLHAQDRLDTNELPLTHDLLSTMLGVRRPTVTLVMNSLVQAGIITTSRGMIRIVDRAMLERRSCECYRAVSGVYSSERRQKLKTVTVMRTRRSRPIAPNSSLERRICNGAFAAFRSCREFSLNFD